MEEKNFFDIYKDAMTKNFSNFEGRARRREYWGFTLINILIIAGYAIFIGILMGIFENTAAIFIGYLFMLPLVLYVLAMIIPSLAITVRRLHDTNKSGWWWLIRFIPFGGFILLIFLVSEGDRGVNLYGLDPKQNNLQNEISEIGES